MVEGFIEKNSDPVVLLLGCGLDSRYQRLGKIADNRQILTTLAQKFKGAEIHIDVLNEWMSKNSAKHDTVKKTNARFNFGVNDLRTFETWHDDIQLKRVYNFQEFKGWRRMGVMTSLLMPIIPVLKTSSRLVHLKIK